jgi:integrase
MAGRKGRRDFGWIRRSGRRWQASYVGPDVLRHCAPRTFTVKGDAEAWLASERRMIELGVWTAPSQREAAKQAEAVTLADYARRWVEERSLKPRTKIGYQASLDNHVADSFLGAVPIRHVTAEAVRSWYTSLKIVGPTARAHAYQLLHAVCATAVADGLLASNPCSIPRAMATKTKRQAVILTPAEVAALADAIEPDRLRALVLVLAWCGPRWGEAIELRRKDLSADCSVLTIARGATHRSGVCRIDTPKSGKGRKVVVPPHIREDLADHLNRHVTKGPEALLFPPARGGCHLNDRVFRDQFQAALTTIGRESVRIHDLRHFAGTQTARVANLAESMARLGHSTVRASLIYQQSVSGRDAEVAEALSKLAEG